MEQAYRMLENFDKPIRKMSEVEISQWQQWLLTFGKLTDEERAVTAVMILGICKNSNDALRIRSHAASALDLHKSLRPNLVIGRIATEVGNMLTNEFPPAIILRHAVIDGELTVCDFVDRNRVYCFVFDLFRLMHRCSTSEATKVFSKRYADALVSSPVLHSHLIQMIELWSSDSTVPPKLFN